MLCQTCSLSLQLTTRSGLGIGAYTGLTHLFINTVVLGVLYGGGYMMQRCAHSRFCLLADIDLYGAGLLGALSLFLYINMYMYIYIREIFLFRLVIIAHLALARSEMLSAGGLMTFLVSTQTVERSLSNMSILFGQARGLTKVF
jgi:hypothetical protein